jgi:UDP-N-acetylmuramyl pentapeptide phosphotransferase/UDP-N-acetylglucosamine-1-phosphate transferase
VHWPIFVVAPDFAAAITVGSALATVVLIALLKPWLLRYALARPNARSSHTIPTPQGGGIAIMITVATVIASTAWHGHAAFQAPWALSLLVAIAVLALVGAVDDLKPLPVLPRLGLQFATAALLMQTLPTSDRLLPFASQFAETTILTVGLVWFINLTNFMDGIDWMTVVEVVPVSAALAALGLFGIVPQITEVLPVVLALLGAMIGFAPVNRHVAKLFLGDVGSLPLGAVTGWLLVVLACAGHWHAALILPLYYLADATITLFRRWLAGENIAQAHRSHFYQRAVHGGYSVPQVTTHVFALNVALAALAVASILNSDPVLKFACLGLGGLATLGVLITFNQGRPA